MIEYIKKRGTIYFFHESHISKLCDLLFAPVENNKLDINLRVRYNGYSIKVNDETLSSVNIAPQPLARNMAYHLSEKMMIYGAFNTGLIIDRHLTTKHRIGRRMIESGILKTRCSLPENVERPTALYVPETSV